MSEDVIDIEPTAASPTDALASTLAEAPREAIADAPAETAAEASPAARQEIPASVPANTPYEISKKELLEQTGISYGQLYRWKREGLIPEEWFHKRSAFTGQETFFPRERTLGRIKAIRAMKDDLSLSEIRERFAHEPNLSNLHQVLLTVSEMSEDFVDGLPLDLEKTTLTETSLKAVAVLYSALAGAQVAEGEQRSLITQVITLLNTAEQGSSNSQEG